MPDPKRVEFITRHFKDLQTIRFGSISAALMLGPLIPPMPHMSREGTWALLVGYLSCAIGFYWRSTVAIRRRYGSVKESRAETLRMQGHPVLVAVGSIALAVLLWFKFVDPNRSWFSDVFTVFVILTFMLPKILDSTNLAIRRVAWAVGLVVLFGGGAFLMVADLGGQASVLAGVVWLSLSIFDFLLLRRTFEEISASPSAEATDVVANFG